MLEIDRKLEEDAKKMVKEEEYEAYMDHLSKEYFASNEDFYTHALFEMGSASQHIDEYYVKQYSDN